MDEKVPEYAVVVMSSWVAVACATREEAAERAARYEPGAARVYRLVVTWSRESTGWSRRAAP